MYTTTQGDLQYGTPKSGLELVRRIGEQVARAPEKGVTVEVITHDPYTNVIGVVTAVGGKYDDILLTVEPTKQESKPERVNRLAAIIREVDGNHDLGAAALAEALIERGVLPTRDW